jgi:hypothetical protein
VSRDEEFPFTTPATSDASMFIQWKGTNVCLDFYCPCGAHGHLDGDFAYHVKCPACGQVYEMGTQVIARKVDGDDHPSTQVLDVDDDERPMLPVVPLDAPLVLEAVSLGEGRWPRWHISSRGNLCPSCSEPVVDVRVAMSGTAQNEDGTTTNLGTQPRAQLDPCGHSVEAVIVA